MRGWFSYKGDQNLVGLLGQGWPLLGQRWIGVIVLSVVCGPIRVSTWSSRHKMFLVTKNLQVDNFIF